VEGRLIRIDDFVVTVEMLDGSARSFRRDGAVPKVEVQDPLAGHLALLPVYTDADMHNMTAFLVTLQ
jgi:cytochrome c oxidase cbb3-type subunit 3